MSLFENPDHLRLLQNLLYPQDRKNDSDTDDDNNAPANQRKIKTPADIGSKKPLKEPAPVEPPKEITPKTIEEWQDLQQQEDADILDTRKCPEYTMTFRQAVGTEDVFLQLSNRTNATASCEDLIIDIALPEETTTPDKMDLSITENSVDLSTPIYRLSLPLAHKVNVDRCQAKYDAERHKLLLTMRLQREFDFVNF